MSILEKSLIQVTNEVPGPWILDEILLGKAEIIFPRSSYLKWDFPCGVYNSVLFLKYQVVLFSCGHLRLTTSSAMFISLLVDRLIWLVKYYNINTQDTCLVFYGSPIVPKVLFFPDLLFGCILDCAEGFFSFIAECYIVVLLNQGIFQNNLGSLSKIPIL